MSGPGESVGRYQGDTLVVDTVGLSTRTFVDNYQTPHTAQLHVVERFRMIDAGKTLEVNVRVEDPGAFTTPWNALQRYRRVGQGPMIGWSAPRTTRTISTTGSTRCRRRTGRISRAISRRHK